MKHALLAVALVLASCGGTEPLTELHGVDESGIVTLVAANGATITMTVEGVAREYELRPETPIIDASGARRASTSIAIGSQVHVRTTISPSGRRTAERITILAGPDAGLPSIIEPPAQD